MKSIQTQITQHLKERGWDKLRPSDIAKSICIEAAELLEVFQWENDDAAATKTDTEKMAKIKEEAADVFIYLFDLAALLDLDTRAMILDKLSQVNQKYPAAAMKAGQYYKYKAKFRN